LTVKPNQIKRLYPVCADCPQNMTGSQGEILMPERKVNGQSQWWMPILKDTHFWVPLIVLMAGLVALRWIR